MGDTNYFSGIVKIVEAPKQIMARKNTLITTFRVEVPQKRKNKVISLVFWGKLSSEVYKFYKINDYILIEGYISLRPKKLIDTNSRWIPKKVVISVLRIYPILLNPNRN